jgi:hypothetical protein
MVDAWGLTDPGGPGNHFKRWGAKPPTFKKGFPGPLGRPDPKIRPFPGPGRVKLKLVSEITLLSDGFHHCVEQVSGSAFSWGVTLWCSWESFAQPSRGGAAGPAVGGERRCGPRRGPAYLNVAISMLVVPWHRRGLCVRSRRRLGGVVFSTDLGSLASWYGTPCRFSPAALAARPAGAWIWCHSRR